MMEWRCNRCHSTEFEQQITGGYSTIDKFDEYGNPEEFTNDIEYANEFCCNECGLSGKLKDIATYQEKDGKTRRQIIQNIIKYTEKTGMDESYKFTEDTKIMVSKGNDNTLNVNIFTKKLGNHYTGFVFRSQYKTEKEFLDAIEKEMGL